MSGVESAVLCRSSSVLLHTRDVVKVKVKEGHTPKERRRGVHLLFIGR